MYDWGGQGRRNRSVAVALGRERRGLVGGTHGLGLLMSALQSAIINYGKYYWLLGAGERDLLLARARAPAARFLPAAQSLNSFCLCYIIELNPDSILDHGEVEYSQVNPQQHVNSWEKRVSDGHDNDALIFSGDSARQSENTPRAI